MLNAFEVMYLLSKDLDILAINIAFLTTVIPRIIFYIVFGIKYAGLKKFAKYLIILDPIAFPMAVSAYAYIIFLTSIFVLSAFDIVNIVLLVILFIVYSAFHRALVMEAIWRKWQIIIYKIMLVIAGGMYIVYGIRYIFPGINWTGG